MGMYIKNNIKCRANLNNYLIYLPMIEINVSALFQAIAGYVSKLFTTMCQIMTSAYHHITEQRYTGITSHCSL